MSSLKLSQKLDQRMVLTPQLRQRIEMLQMNSLELSELVQTELISNPILEEVGNDEEVQEISQNILDQNAEGYEDFESNSELSSNAPTNGEGTLENYSIDPINENGFNEDFTPDAEFESENSDYPTESRDAFEEVDYGQEFKDYLDPGYKTQEIEHKEDAPSFEQFLTRSESLMEHLEFQINLLQISEILEDAAICIVGNLDENGRLNATNDEIAEMCGSSVDLIEKARQIVLKLDPVGCGARDVTECLIVQLEQIGEGESLAVELVRNHFTDLQAHRLQHLSKDTGIDYEKLKAEIEKIKQLEPYPGRRYSSEEPVFVAPEVYIEKIDEDYIIYFTDDGSPRLRISHTYQKMLDRSDFCRKLAKVL